VRTERASSLALDILDGISGFLLGWRARLENKEPKGMGIHGLGRHKRRLGEGRQAFSVYSRSSWFGEEPDQGKVNTRVAD
jgi:hypothetical protein